MNILHLCEAKVFTTAYVNFINENFDANEHEFLIYGQKAVSMSCMEQANVKYRRNIAVYLSNERNRKKMLTFDKIIIHGLFNVDLIDKWYRDKQLCAKTYLYLWGGDFYPSKYNTETIMQKMKRRKLIRNAAGIINILKIENDIVKKLYRVKGKMFDAMYFDQEAVGLAERYYKVELQKDDTIRIQVGNSATEENNHLAILEKLSKYKDEKIEIYVPLSYGNAKYAQDVEVYGKKVFGNKFIALKEFMPKDDYYLFMRKMDVAIIDVQRQQALGNLAFHLYFGNILYLNKKSVVNYYCKREIGYKVRHTNYIGEIPFHKFSKMNLVDKKHNHDLAHDFYSSKDVYIKKWKKVFDSVETL